MSSYIRLWLSANFLPIFSIKLPMQRQRAIAIFRHRQLSARFRAHHNFHGEKWNKNFLEFSAKKHSFLCVFCTILPYQIAIVQSLCEFIVRRGQVWMLTLRLLTSSAMEISIEWSFSLIFKNSFLLYCSLATWTWLLFLFECSVYREVHTSRRQLDRLSQLCTDFFPILHVGLITQ